MDTKTQILDAAQDLIQRVGANAMSYQDISEAVGIRKASIHYHFPTKDKLLEELIKRYSADFLEQVDAVVASKGDAAAKLRQYIGLFELPFRQRVYDKACLCGMLGAEVLTLETRCTTEIQDFYAANEKRLVQILRQGLKERSLRFSGDPKAVAAMVFTLLQGALIVVRAKGGVKAFRAITAQLMKLLEGKPT